MSDCPTYRVWCLTWDDTEDDGRDVVTIAAGEPVPPRAIAAGWGLDAESAAEAYAEYCQDHRDGWESEWPLTFRVRKPDGTTEDFEVEREYEPTFSARSTT